MESNKLISERDVAPLEHIAPGVSGMHMVFVNVFAVEDADGWVLVDAGLPLSAGRIRAWTNSLFGEGSRPKAILLTHGHFDHVGAVEHLIEEWDVPVFAHALELPYLTGESSYPPPDATVGGGLMAVMAPLYPRGPINLGNRVTALPSDGSVPGLPSWKWIFTPGHTAGHISLFRPSDRTLIVGDAFCTTKPESFLTVVATQKPELHGPPAYYTPDWDAARLSVAKLADLGPEVIAPGHGMPMRGATVASALKEFARRFEELAVPEKGRYIDDRDIAAAS
jgi:glyoxylase-like metal-dependent hydrolase (beta-lactamase superfamily II)